MWDRERALLAHRDVLDAAAAMAGAIDLNREPVGRWVPVALLSRLLHLGEAIHRLVDQGFGDASEPLARAMTSAAISIVAIVDGDSDSRALAFLAETINVRQKRLKALAEHGLMDQTAADAHEASVGANDQAVLASYAKKALTPIKLGNRPTWHGLTDHDLFDRMKAAWWYDLYYAPFSDEAHANAAAINPEISALREGAGIIPGPRDGDQTLVLLGSAQTICQRCASSMRNVDGGGRTTSMLPSIAHAPNSKAPPTFGQTPHRPDAPRGRMASELGAPTSLNRRGGHRLQGRLGSGGGWVQIDATDRESRPTGVARCRDGRVR